MHFHNSCTQNYDHHIRLVMAGNAHKESCHKLLLTLKRRPGVKYDPRVGVFVVSLFCLTSAPNFLTLLRL